MADIDIRCVKNDTLGRYPCAASQTISIGDPVTVDGDGNVILADASSATLLGVAGRDVAATAAGDEILVYDDPDAEFELAADNVDQVLQTNVLGLEFDLVVPGGVFKANLDASVTDVFLGISIGGFNDPLRDGSVYYGSALAGDWTPGWQSKNVVRVKINKHV
jgi:hypothetical protein